MNVAATFVLGLLIGWLIEWVIDWFYWRNRVLTPVEESKPLDEPDATLIKANKNLDEENTNLKERLASLQAELDKIAAASALAHLLDEKGNDNLLAIHGIGPVFAKRLKEAGVDTFERLSQLTSQEMEAILGTLFKRFYSKENAIRAQAKEFAEQKARFGRRKA